ncbi:S-layer family protein [Rivularia sp. UHCC 0363]|uniref:S-layer family protein n=1 Tax=Rivularia sp. UHCC 0363 TaxID=3110244 RepID=UPI002B205BD9|nr:S-layer family protein [Rivularia sp. UHCC 0363]MEA5596756.1 S-layer family protein [Rivularia sp. UHCC 0363]
MKGIYWLGLGIASLQAFINPCFAQSSNIVPDDSLGAESSGVVPLDSGGLAVDAIDGGAIRGANLFHSFTEFNVSEGRGAYFFSPNAEIQNILTRVTGRNPSEILGTLGTFGNSQPNLFLINPNGIVFGENASLDVGGSFVATTANGINLGETGLFSATEPTTSNLLSVNPSALFFNAVNTQAGIVNRSTATSTVLGSAENGDANRPINGLQVLDGKSLLLVGGDVSLDGGRLLAPGGRVELGGLAAPGSIQLQQEDDIFSLNFPSLVERASVFLNNNANVNVISTGEGSVVVNARNLNILGSGIVSGVTSGGVNSNAGNIEINTTDTTTIDGTSSTTSFSGIASGLVGGSGGAGDITINTGSLDVINAQIGSLTNGEGNAGNVTIIAKDKVSISGTNSGIASFVAPSGVGNGANVSIQAREVFFDNSVISTNSLGKGSSGNIQIKADNSVFVSGGSTISSETFGQGNAGSIDIEAGNLVSFDGVGSNNRVRQVSSRVNPLIVAAPEFTGERIGGDINIKTGSLSIKNANLETSTYGKGNAGNVQVRATDAVSLVDAYILSTVEAGGDGQGGNINIDAATLTLRDSAQLITITREASEAQPAGQGDAGNVNVKVSGLVDIAGEKNDFYSGIFSYVDTGTEGDGGNITIGSGFFSLTDGAQLQASTSGKGNAGNVKVTTTDTVSLAGNAYILSTVEVGGEGQGGNIDINAATLSLTDGAQLLTLIRGASDTDTQAGGQGDAGNVNVKVSGFVDIAGKKNDSYSGIYSVADTGTVGNAGNITIDSSSFLLRDGALINARTKTDGQGGNVTVNTDIFEALEGGQLIAITSSNGSAGNITVNATQKMFVSGSDPDYNNRLIQFPDYLVIVGANSGLFVNSSGLGNTGDIEVNSPQVTLDNQGTLNAQSTSGNGGNISLTSDLLLMRRGAQISTNAGTAQQGGDGGNIDINSKFIIAPSQENSDITANAYSGTGGNVKILSQGIFGIEPRTQQTDRSDITASSDLGVPGNLNLTDPDDSSIRNNLDDLPDSQIDTNAIIANSCIARGTKRQENSFKITGSGGLRNSPGDGFISEYSTGDVRNVEPTRAWKKGDRIVEPTGLYKLSDGRLLLSRTC